MPLDYSHTISKGIVSKKKKGEQECETRVTVTCLALDT